MAKVKTIVINHKEPDIDLDKRILRNVVFMTAAVARDGMMVLPTKLRLDRFQADPKVLERHQSNIGRAMDLGVSTLEMTAAVQFADNKVGRDYAYMYGVNEQREVFARSWSGDADIVQTDVWRLNRVARYLGDMYDEDLMPQWVVRNGEVVVVTRGVLDHFAVTPRPADVLALTRAFEEHKIDTAGRIVRELQTNTADGIIEELQRENEINRDRIEKLERDIKVLRGEEPSPAMLDDCEGIVRELNLLRETIRKK